MTTLYVAGPMTGILDFNYPEFNEVADNLRECGYTVLNPADVDAIHKRERQSGFARHACNTCDDGLKHEWPWYMKRTLRMMLDADGIALLRGWSQSRGAKIEAFVGKAVGMDVMPWQNWVLRMKEGEAAPTGRKSPANYKREGKPRKKVQDL